MVLQRLGDGPEDRGPLPARTGAHEGAAAATESTRSPASFSVATMCASTRSTPSVEEGMREAIPSAQTMLAWSE